MSGASPPVKRYSRGRLGVFLLVVGGLTAGGWWWHGQRQLQHQLHAAQAALDRHDCWRALAEVQPCLRAWGARLEVRLLAARAARLADALDEAEDHLTICQRMIESEPEAADEVRFERKLLAMQQGDTKSRAAQWQPSFPVSEARQLEALDALARGFAETHHFGEALGCLDQIAQRDPEYLPMLLSHGQIRLRHKRYEEAEGYFEKMLAVLPEALLPRLQLAECLIQTGQPRAAVAHLDLLNERYPDDADVLYALGRCHVYRNQLEQAKQRFDQLLAKHPRHYDAWVARGRLEFRIGEPALAEKLLRRAIDVHPDLVDAWLVLEALMAENASQTASCRAEIERIENAMGRQQRRMLWAVEAESKKLQLFMELGDGWRDLHTPREAQRWYFCALQEDPDHRPAHRALAEIFAETGQPHRAARHRALAAE
jgi:tetratricopeptide (TPR) repeat protein